MRTFSTISIVGSILVLQACGKSSDSSTAAPAVPLRLLCSRPGRSRISRGSRRVPGSDSNPRQSRCQISHIQTKTPAEFEENFRQYGAQGYSLVFGHGFEFQDAAKRVAPEFPKTIYVTTSGIDRRAEPGWHRFRLRRRVVPRPECSPLQ